MANKRHDQRPRVAKATAVADLTAGDLARFLAVDLKTIHNWVNQGQVFARRTEGRHLRFQRVEVVRFLRRVGHSVPPAIGRAEPHVLSVRGVFPRGAAGVVAAAADGFLAAVLEVAGGAHEVLVLDLDAHPPVLSRELVQALRARPETRGIGIVGLSTRAGRRAELVATGGDVALSQGGPGQLVQSARYLTGAVDEPPRSALVPAPPG
jgi:hypothetical protein